MIRLVPFFAFASVRVRAFDFRPVVSTALTD